MYRWVDHTSEVELAIDAASEEQVLRDAVSALAELLGFVGGVADVSRQLAVGAADRPALLAAWLEELVFLGESEGFVALEVRELELDDEGVGASVGGLIADPAPLVKAVTYHRLQFERSGAGYVANVVLDV